MTAKKILLLGATGQLGQSFRHALDDQQGFAYRTSARPSNQSFEPHLRLDLSGDFSDNLASFCREFEPDYMINCAAYTNVDEAESQTDLANAINGNALAQISAVCKQQGIYLIHFSTDFVYDGAGELPFKEDARPAPLNAYGASKLLGEKAIIAANIPASIFRISWVFSPYGKNFVKTILRLSTTREKLNVVGDQYGSPTSAPMVARIILESIKMDMFHRLEPAPNVFNLSCAGVVNWYGFTEQILRLAESQGRPITVKELDMIPASEYPSPAARPSNSRMNQDKFSHAFGITRTSWETELASVMKSLNHG